MCRWTISAFIVVYVLTTSSCKAKPPVWPWNLGPLSMPESCEGRNLCFNKHENYPDELIEALLNDTDFRETQTDIIEDRTEGDEGDDQCSRTVRKSPIYEIIDDKGDFRFVVQSDKFKQIIRTEECSKEGLITENTRSFNSYIVKHNRLLCRPHRLNYTFLVLSLNEPKLETAKMKDGVPVACTCHRESE